MILIKPLHERRIELPGVPSPVPRPVDIDSSVTGFASLRTLRIYRFEEGSVIEGHAEEDEVFIVVLSGAVELTMTANDIAPVFVMLSDPLSAQGDGCAAYLPPGAAYKLIARSDADVAYARATPVGARPPQIFAASRTKQNSGVHILLDQRNYAERLRLRLLEVPLLKSDLSFTLAENVDPECEALIHFRITPSERQIEATSTESDPILLDSWDTLAIAPLEPLSCKIGSGTSALILVTMAE